LAEFSKANERSFLAKFARFEIENSVDKCINIMLKYKAIRE
jgi:hypothetical protein